MPYFGPPLPIKNLGKNDGNCYIICLLNRSAKVVQDGSAVRRLKFFFSISSKLLKKSRRMAEESRAIAKDTTK
jgi:hypothetical protein